MTSSIAIELAITVLISGSLFALTALGFTIVYRVTKILHLAHGVVVLASGYGFWWALMRGASFAFAVVFALALSIAIGWCMHTFVYEHLRRRGKVATTMSLIATLALLILGQNVLLALFGSATRLVTIASNWPLFFIGDVSLTSVQLLVIGVSFATLIVTAFVLRRTRLGKGMRAVADNETVAYVVGINVSKVRALTFCLASLLAGIAGILYALEFNLDHSMGTDIAIRSFSRAVIGGIGSLPGAFVGSFIIEVVEDFGAFFYQSGFKTVFSFVVVFLVLFFRPRGLFGERVRREDL